MDIVLLADRFSIYAQRNIALSHDPDDKKQTSFLECDVEELQAAIKNGLKLPCLLLQTPEFEKKGSVDSISESVEGSFLVLDRYKTGDRKSPIHQRCKNIADQIINYMIEDSDSHYEGGLPETSEGKVPPLVDGLIGWGVNFGFTQGYNGEVDEQQRRELQ